MKMVTTIVQALILLIGVSFTGCATTPTDTDLDPVRRAFVHGDWEKARTLIADTTGGDSSTPRTIYYRGLEHEFAGRYRTALNQYTDVVNRDQSFHQAAFDYIRLALRHDQLEDARQMIDFTLFKYPEMVEPHVFRTRMAIIDGDLDSAAVHMGYAKVAEADPATLALLEAEIDVKSFDPGKSRSAADRLEEINCRTVEQYLYRAELYHFLSQYEKAIDDARSAVHIGRDNILAELELGWQLYHTRRLREALATAESLIERIPEFGPAFQLAAWCHFKLGNEIVAETNFFKIFGTGQHTPGLYEQQADMHAAFDRHDAAAAMYQTAYSMSAIENFPKTYTNSLVQNSCMQYLFSGQPTMARTVMQEAGVDVARDADFYFIWATIASSYPDGADSAKAMITKALSQYIDDKAWMAGAALYFKQQADYDRAWELYDTLLQAYMPQREWYLTMVDMVHQAKDPDKADSLYQVLPWMLKNDYTVLEYYHDISADAGRLDDARKYSQQLFEQAPMFLPYAAQWATYLADDGKIEEARKIYTDLIKNYPDDIRAYYQLGRFELDHGHSSTVRDLSEKIIEIDSTSAIGFELQGLALLEEGKDDSAVAAFQGAIEHKSTSPWPYYYVTMNLIKETPAPLRAEGLAMAAHRYFAGQRPGFMLLGKTFLAREKYRLAMQNFYRGTLLFPEDAEYRFYYGKALHLLGDDAKAREELQKALDLGLGTPHRAEAEKLIG